MGIHSKAIQDQKYRREGKEYTADQKRKVIETILTIQSSGKELNLYRIAKWSKLKLTVTAEICVDLVKEGLLKETVGV